MALRDWKFDPETSEPVLCLEGTELKIRPVRLDRCLLREATDDLAPSQFCLREWEEYIVHGAQGVTIVGNKVDDLGDGVFRFRFENQIGRANLRFSVPAALPVILPVEVLSTKYPTPDKHLQFFRALLADLSMYAAQLPFAITAPTEATVDESAAAPTPLFVYNFLLDRHNDEELRTALNIILAAPHRRLSDESRWVATAEASVVDTEMLSQVLTHPEYLAPAAKPPALACAAAFRGLVPTRVWQQLPRDTFDTSENRFVRAYLGELLRAAQEVREQCWWQQVPTENRTLIDDLIGYMAEVFRASLFDEVGDMVVFPASSQVLLRRDGYRELLALWRLFQLARQPFFANLQAAIELRNVAMLYEFWCFYRLAAKLSAVLGTSPEPCITVTDEKGLTYNASFKWGEQSSLVFNQSFPGGTADCYSVALRPDFTFVPPPGFLAHDQRIIFDAKFRFESSAWSIDDDDDSLRVANRADLHKMHTYRDALHARSAIALFPGIPCNASEFYCVGKGRVQPDPTFKEALHLEGVGAFSMEPGKGT